jgi:hypothetical protein
MLYQLGDTFIGHRHLIGDEPFRELRADRKPSPGQHTLILHLIVHRQPVEQRRQ